MKWLLLLAASAAAVGLTGCYPRPNYGYGGYGYAPTYAQPMCQPVYAPQQQQPACVCQ